jgi:peptidoglycan hydrolase-like protein with peptidoglycan-binding domain
MRHTLTVAVAASMIWLSMAAAQTKKKSSAPAAKKAAVSTKSNSAKKAPARSTTSRSTTARKGTSNRKAASKKPIARRPAVTWRNRQTVPSPDRYREIQSALAARGFLASEDATGNWNQASTDALKRFQQEQNLDATGKVNSLSLIALGLGPKRDAAVVVPKAQDLPSQPPVDR